MTYRKRDAKAASKLFEPAYAAQRPVGEQRSSGIKNQVSFGSSSIQLDSVYNESELPDELTMQPKRKPSSVALPVYKAHKFASERQPDVRALPMTAQD